MKASITSPLSCAARVHVWCCVRLYVVSGTCMLFFVICYLGFTLPRKQLFNPVSAHIIRALVRGLVYVVYNLTYFPSSANVSFPFSCLLPIASKSHHN